MSCCIVDLSNRTLLYRNFETVGDLIRRICLGVLRRGSSAAGIHYCGGTGASSGRSIYTLATRSVRLRSYFRSDRTTGRSRGRLNIYSSLMNQRRGAKRACCGIQYGRRVNSGFTPSFFAHSSVSFLEISRPGSIGGRIGRSRNACPTFVLSRQHEVKTPFSRGVVLAVVVP